MFDIGWQELLVLAVLAIIVIGPKDLPRAIKTITVWVRKARGMARDLQDGLDDMVRESELNDIKEQANSIMGNDLDPTSIVARELEMTGEQREWSKAVDNFNDATDPEQSGKENIDNNNEVHSEHSTSSLELLKPDKTSKPERDTVDAARSKVDG